MRVVSISVSNEYNDCFDKIEKMGDNKSQLVCKAVSDFVNRPIILAPELWNMSQISKKELKAMDTLIQLFADRVTQELVK